MFYKMKNGLCPDYLVSLVPATVGSASTYPLRNSSDLQTLHTNSRLYYTSFLPSAVRDWNELPEQTRNSPSLNIFKNSLKSNLIIPPRYYNTGKRLGQIYHARLRTACSPLRQHLHSKNIVDNPYCTCGDIEDTHHFLFVCHQYTDLRRDLLNSVSDICQPNLNVLLMSNFNGHLLFQADCLSCSYLNPPGGTNFTLPVLILSLKADDGVTIATGVLSTRLVFTVY